LAEGSYGQVILAVRLHKVQSQNAQDLQFQIGQKVAIKIFIHPANLSRDQATEEYQASMDHFFAEENYLSQLSHPHIVRVYEAQREVEVNVPAYIRQTKESIDN
jgi:serine/threonine protein kinase